MDIQLYKERMYNIIGAAMSLYNEIGSGYSEPIYQECLSVLCSEKGYSMGKREDVENVLSWHRIGENL